MTRRLQAILDPKLEARVTERLAMVYEDGPSDEEDRPPHVRAASGLSAFREYLAVIQDDANWLALIDADQRILAVPLPPGPSGARIFSSERGNKDEKYDLEACITVPGENGHELIGFSSGSHPGREWILRVHEELSASGQAPGSGADGGDGGIGFSAEFLDATRFYDALRSNTEFCGAGLNIEGAVALDDDRIMLFQRGNARARDGIEPVDSTAEISWAALAAHLADPAGIEAPPLENVTVYELGSLDGVRLTFSDAEDLGGGRILYSASAEDSDSDRIAGSVLGVIEPDGRVCYTELTNQDGTAFRGKIEGLSRDVHDPGKMHFVIDDDDADVPSEIYAATLSERFFSPGSA